MDRTEKIELCVLCLVYDGDRILLHSRNKDGWKGVVFPGGHVEPGESVVDAVTREVMEETGLTIRNPKLCGIKQFPGENGRFLVLLFKTGDFFGKLRSSVEGEVWWEYRQNLKNMDMVPDFYEMLTMFDRDDLTELQYVNTPDGRQTVIK